VSRLLSVAPGLRSVEPEALRRRLKEAAEAVLSAASG